jgi:NNP family nitrate/nitrite transporter-like MFS transporter
MNIKNKAIGIKLFDLSSLQMRTFHMTWFAFFLCFFGWFGIAPLMGVIRDELLLSKAQIGNIIIASVAMTIVARLVIGNLCDRIGPRRVYTWLLILGSLPVMGIGLAHSYTSFLLFRLAIGVIGASFVVTQHHTSMMFAPNCVGTANATTGGWGNLGGGVTQIVMPLFFAVLVGLGYSSAISWRLVMIIPGVLMIVTGIAYYLITKDTADGDFKDLRKNNDLEDPKTKKESLKDVCRDHKVWALCVIYGACFGIELTMNNIAALYFMDNFGLTLKTAGLIAGLFGLMNLFTRTLGGFLGDKAGMKWGLKGRVSLLGMVLFLEGSALVLFSNMRILPLAMITLVIFALCVQVTSGVTFSIVPFINKKSLGTVSGIVGSGGNMGAVLAGFLFKIDSISWSQALLILGVIVCMTAGVTVFIRFSKTEEHVARLELESRLKLGR